MKRAQLLLVVWVVAPAQAQEAPRQGSAVPAPATPSVLALGACARTPLPCESSALVRGFEPWEALLKLDEAVERAQVAPDSALAWTVTLRYRDTKWLVQVVDLTKPHANCPLAPGDAVWFAARPAPGEPRLASDVVLVTAVRAVLATPLTDERRTPLLVWLLTRSADRVDRQQAAQELARLPNRARAVRLLVSVLDLDPSVAREAVVALGTMGKDAAPALPELQRLLDHRDQTLRVVAAAAVRQIESTQAR